MDWARLKEWARLKALLSAGAGNVRASDSVGRTALHYAAGYGECDAVAALLARGALVSATDRFGAAPLHWACLKAHALVIEQLLGAAADPLVRATAGVFSGRSSLDLLSAHGGSAEVSAALTKTLGASLFEQRKVLGRGGFGTIIKVPRTHAPDGKQRALPTAHTPPRPEHTPPHRVHAAWRGRGRRCGATQASRWRSRRFASRRPRRAGAGAAAR